MTKKLYLSYILIIATLILVAGRISIGPLSFHNYLSFTGIMTISFLPGVILSKDRKEPVKELTTMGLLAVSLTGCYTTYYYTDKILYFILKCFVIVGGRYIAGVYFMYLKYRHVSGKTNFAIVFRVLSGIFIVFFFMSYCVFFATEIRWKDINSQPVKNETRVSLLNNFFDDKWKKLDRRQKLNAVRNLARLEQEKLGIYHRLDVDVDHEMKNNALAYYSPTEHKIFINSELIENGSPKEVIGTLCHEAYHRAQYCYMEAYKEIDKKYKNLTFFNDARTFNTENMFYESKDYEKYKNQMLEVTSRIYSENRTKEYMEEITGLMIYQ